MGPLSQAFKFKTELVLVDDDDKILNLLEKSFSSRYQLAVFNDAREGIKYLNNIEDIEIGCSVQKDRILNKIPYGEIFELFEKINAGYKVPSVVVSDFQMPFFSGVEVLGNVKQKSIGKILFSGVATVDEAVAEFNRGSITGFIEKGVDAVNNLTKILNKNDEKFFSSVSSDPILTIDQEIEEILLPILRDSKSFYIFDSDGSVVVENNDKEFFTYYTMSKSDIKIIVDMLGEVGHRFMNEVETGKYIPLLQDLPDNMIDFDASLYDSSHLVFDSDKHCMLKLKGYEYIVKQGREQL